MANLMGLGIDVLNTLGGGDAIKHVEYAIAIPTSPSAWRVRRLKLIEELSGINQADVDIETDNEEK